MANDQREVPQRRDVTRLALEACYQIESVVQALHAASSDSNMLPWLVRSAALRLDDLNGVVLLALNPESGGGVEAAEEDMRARLFGRFGEVQNG